LSFDELKRIAAAKRLDIEGLKDCTGACSSCGACEPYVRLMLRTGQTCLPILDRKTCDELMSSPTPSSGSGKGATAAA
jgi:bacterioferritin-associated ferredoxin